MSFDTSGLTRDELYLFNTGEWFHSYRSFGAHLITLDGVQGVRFVVWAPHAVSVRVVGSFNDWCGDQHQLSSIASTGVWWLFVPHIGEGVLYKYEVITQEGERLLKADPYAFFAERRPGTASIVKKLTHYRWQDHSWMENKERLNSYQQPMLIYEVHLGTWRIKGKEDFYTYDELAESLVSYVKEIGYTHIELLPIMEHPFDRSWGYQTTGYYAATSRYGHPEQLMKLIDTCHQHHIGVILDWVPGHFCKDDHGLRLFDGTPLYEGADVNRAEKPLWGTLAFDYSCTEVQSFLISNALFWMEVFHFDGLRVDAVASMTDLHFDKPEEMFTYNVFGGRENLDALHFLKRLNETIFHYYPSALMIAEDSSSMPKVTSPTSIGGLGFNYKWNMGWMNDMLKFMSLDPHHRSQHHQLVTFSIMYAFNENYVLPLSHDEVVHGKNSLLNKMPGDYEQRFAQLRLFYGFWITHPGKKLLFMGGEWAHYDEWKDLDQLDWMLLDYEKHDKMQQYSKALYQFYRNHVALWELDSQSEGFEWLDVHNAQAAMISFRRKGIDELDDLLVICNFSGDPLFDYNMGVPRLGQYQVVFHSNEPAFGGADSLLNSCYAAEEVPWHGRAYRISITVPSFSCVILKQTT
jgi:1,4-alpha-glucan branching enzyme